MRWELWIKANGWKRLLWCYTANETTTGVFQHIEAYYKARGVRTALHSYREKAAA